MGVAVGRRFALKAVVHLEAVAVLAALFGAVQRKVGALVQPFKGLVGVRQAYADAGCQADGAVFPHRKLQRITDLGRLAMQQFFGNAHPGQENRKLIPAEPAYDIAGPEQAGQHPGRFPDRLVAGLVAQNVSLTCLKLSRSRINSAQASPAKARQAGGGFPAPSCPG